MTEKQPESLRLANALNELDAQFSFPGLCGEAAAELRRLHQSEREGWRHAAELEQERERLTNLCHDYLGELTAMRAAKQMQHRIEELKSQREWDGLTDEAIWIEYQRFWPFHPAEEPRLAKDISKFAKAIEAKLKEKNT